MLNRSLVCCEFFASMSEAPAASCPFEVQLPFFSSAHEISVFLSFFTTLLKAVPSFQHNVYYISSLLFLLSASQCFKIQSKKTLLDNSRRTASGRAEGAARRAPALSACPRMPWVFSFLPLPCSLSKEGFTAVWPTQMPFVSLWLGQLR